MEGDESVTQHRVALFGIDGQHQGGKAGDLFQPLQQLLHLGKLLTVAHKAHQHLPGNHAPADIDMPQQSLVGSFIVDRNAELVDIIHNRVFHSIGFLRQNQAALILHHIVGAGAEKARVGSAFFGCQGILGLVPVAVTGGSGENGHFLQTFPADAV